MVQGKPGSAQPPEAVHIWEQPLPQEPIHGGHLESGTYENQGSVLTMPCRGTMTGPVSSNIYPPGSDVESLGGTWGGTKTYYKPEVGWKEVSQVK